VTELLQNITPLMAMLITVAALIVIGVLVATNLMGSDYANVIAAYLIGGGSGVALTAGFTPPGKSI
jgi:hypothetical protein